MTVIKLQRAERPADLDADTVTSLTEEFIANQTSVWNKTYIKERLLQSSGNKCAYCENNILEESKYMEVEHFRCKDDFPHLVVEWDNLLPSCKRCNGRKSSHNVDTEGMIVDPYNDHPPRHMYLQNYRIYWRDELGRNTIDTLYLNDTDRMVLTRMRIGEGIARSLEVIRDTLERYIADDQRRQLRNRVVRGLEKLLNEAQPTSEYSATAATALLMDQNYRWIKDNLILLDLWGPLAPLEEVAVQGALIP